MHKTGEKAPTAGKYNFVRYVNAKPGTAQPTANEKTISLTSGETFPPIRSTGEAAYWSK
jgi:hypothetical protein